MSARLGPADTARIAVDGLRARPVRAVLSAVGIAIGIAAMVAVLGISASSRAQLDATLDRLGTDLLTAGPGRTLLGEDAQLPRDAVAMVGRIGPVTAASATGVVDARVYRTDHVPPAQTGGLAVLAARLDLLDTVGAEVATGTWLNAATAEYPAVVLGADAAARTTAAPGAQVWLGERWFTVVGVLAPAPLAPELDTAALVGWPVAEQLLGFDGHPTTVYERSAEDAVEAVAAVLAATANPEDPQEVEVSRPSDALAAQAAADSAFTGLLLGVGAVALLVGGVGVANTMVIAVLERRAEIGLRRALGATRKHVRDQFVAEAVVLSGLGGLFGVLLGAAVTTAYAMGQGWPATVPAYAWAGGLLTTVAVGALAGLYPAVRASHLPPVEALASA
ncbi:ABC transporter permease [Pseudonocardia humida]|uniref:ABC transporter permease n=1 Tax=Pseudonocardia humida TaxID=2800819 RepID=A0ABT1A0F8_9PSEU|nr:ABC transporter permease [Pseudonocardia humida]MCO1656488.1 ABC transporter permease [Pseudonocardia humida]